MVQAPLEPYQKSSVGYTFSNLDKELLQELRQICAKAAENTGKEKYLVQIADLMPMTFVDLVCKVSPLSVLETQRKTKGPADTPRISLYTSSLSYCRLELPKSDL